MDNEFNDIALKVMVTGGGTGGHLFPAIALVQELKTRQEEIGKIEFLFIGTQRGIESRILQNSGYDFRPIWIRGFQRGLTFRDIGINLLFPVKLVVSLFQSYFILKKFQPDIAIGTGGFTAGPPLRVASWMKIPFFIHEQNVHPGATTQMLAKQACRIYVSFEETVSKLEGARYLGTPLRRTLKNIPKDQAIRFFELQLNKRTLLIFGGSQGSRAINRHWAEHISKYLETNDFQIIWQTGQSDYEELKAEFGHLQSVYITPFIHEMEIAYSAADVVVSRAGALTLAELCLYGKPSILIPLPTAAGNHQEMNARNFESAGASAVVLQSELSTTKLGDQLKTILQDTEKINQMSKNALSLARPNSAKLIIDDILEYVEHNL